MEEVASIILAAGKGTRMKSRLPKVLHNLCGKPMLTYVIQATAEAGVDRKIVVTGYAGNMVREKINAEVEWVDQSTQMGTGHAVMQAEPLLAEFGGSILILCGDTPLITPAALTQLIQTHVAAGNAVTVLTAVLDDPSGYGRIERDHNGHVQKIIEHRDASPRELKIKEINTGIYCFAGSILFAGLRKITPANSQEEYYLTDVLAVLAKDGERIGTVTVADPLETMGINNRLQLAEADKILRQKKLARLMLDGVTIIDPEHTYIEGDAVIGPDSVIYPGTIIEGNCRLGENCQIGPYTRLKDVETGDGVSIQNSIILESSVGNNAAIGPFAYIRPGTVLGDGVKVGDFVEIKKSVIKTDSKVMHLSYIGDAEIGEKVNVGAGTITCNYDGSKKWPTIIGNNAFIGSNTNLVAPLEVGDNAVIGAGSTVTKDVPEGALCIERSKQTIYRDWAARKKMKK